MQINAHDLSIGAIHFCFVEMVLKMDDPLFSRMILACDWRKLVEISQ